MNYHRLAPVLFLFACGSGNNQSSAALPITPTQATTPTETTAAAGSCSAPLVAIQTGSDASCNGGNTHMYPVYSTGASASKCHGWRSVDTRGQQHDNSANNLRCNGDGTFSFVQYADSLNCTGTITNTKTFTPGRCAQDIPPTLYSVPTDMSCCSAPGSAACRTGVPSVTVAGSSIYLDSQKCAS